MRVLKSMKTVDPTYLRLTRRLFLGGAVAIPFAVSAHEDHGAAQIIADAQVTSLEGAAMTLNVSIYNRAPHAVTLFSVLAPGAAAVEALFVTIEGSGQAEVTATLHFEGPIPGIFTAVLDFGEDGQGPVLVIP